MDLVDGLSEDLGAVRNAVPDKTMRSSPGGGADSNEASEQFQKDFLSHVEENSAGYSNATFNSRDLANLVVQASNDLEGEAKENLKRLMQFVKRDDQVLFISSFDPPEDRKSARVLNRFMELLNKSTPKWASGKADNYTLVIGNKIRYLMDLKREEREKIKEDKARLRDGLQPMWRERLDRIRRDVKEIGKQIKEAREKVFTRAITLPLGQGNWGYTSDGSKRVVIVDRSGLVPSERFVPGVRADAKLIAKQMEETMRFRANNQKLTDEEQNRYKFVAGRFDEGKTHNAYLYVYAHELGHQIHYRSGAKLVPEDSTTWRRGSTFPHSNRGISDYSRKNHNEAFAEAFAAFIFNPKALREYDEPLYKWVKSNFEVALEKAGSPLPL